MQSNEFSREIQCEAAANVRDGEDKEERVIS